MADLADRLLSDMSNIQKTSNSRSSAKSRAKQDLTCIVCMTDVAPEPEVMYDQPAI